MEAPLNNQQSPSRLTTRVEANQQAEQHIIEPVTPMPVTVKAKHHMQTRSQRRQQPTLIPALPHELAQSTIGPPPYKQIALHQITMNEFISAAQANSIIHPETGATLEYEQLITDPLFQKEWL